MFKVKIIFTVILILFAVLITYMNFCWPEPKGYLDVGTFWILTLTLIALIWYAADTYIIAKDSEANAKERNLQKNIQAKKHKIWYILDQKTFLTIDNIAKETGLDLTELSPLLFEMIQEGIIYEDAFKQGFTRYKPENNTNPYG